MPNLVWDRVGDRRFENGLDRGVLYLPDGSAVPWNGLTEIIEKFDKSTSPVFFDGMKINDLISLGSFSASMKAITYPDEFVELEGYYSDHAGIYYADQKPTPFGLCYRTQIGNDVEGDVVGYKIHIVYNVTAIPSDKAASTISDDPTVSEFEWTITAVPEEFPGFRPTAHIIIDTTKTDPWLLEELEEMFYGSLTAEAALIPMTDLAAYISEWFRIQITDLGDGRWTATTQRDGFIHFGIDDYFEITGANAVYLDDVTFQISDTKDISEVPQIKITDNGDGTWIAITEHEALIVMVGEDEFEIRNANADYLDANLFRISDTVE